MYGVIPRIFSDTGLAGVADRCADLSALGVTHLWLSPIFAHPPGDFGYAMTDYRALDPEYGTAADLHQLVETAHRHDLRVLLDFAPNHTSSEHPFYLDVQAHNTASSYETYYVRRPDGQHDYYFNWTNLINLDYRTAEVEEHVMDALAYWVSEFDIDGYRMDAAWGVRNRTPDFWPRCVKALLALKPDLFLLAEASARDPYYLEAGFDAAYDWTDELGVWAWTEAFAAEPSPAAALHRLLTDSSDHGTTLRFLNNNDTDERFISRHGSDRFKLATALLLTLPGIPCLYMGDEVGVEFSPYKQRETVTYPDAPDLVAFHRELIALRREHLGTTHDAVMVETDEPGQCLAYRQPATGGGEVLCVLNFGPARDVVVRSVPRGDAAVDLLSGATYAAAGDRLTVPLDSDGFAVIRL